ncbi:hypothetical protein JBE04_17165, partial [Streptomyces sp. PRKS01-29]
MPAPAALASGVVVGDAVTGGIVAGGVVTGGAAGGGGTGAGDGGTAAEVDAGPGGAAWSPAPLKAVDGALTVGTAVG